MTTLSTHVLDTATGAPAAGMRVHLARWSEGGWEPVAETRTDHDGRASGFGELSRGRYRLGFETGEQGSPMFPFVHVVFELDEDRPHWHLPLLLAPYGYTTYRGS